MNESYSPINCDFHDELEAIATLRNKCVIVYRNSDGEMRVQDYIDDVYAQNGEEFIKLRSGLIIRLDALVEVDGKSLPLSCEI
ncbi:MAG: hypothetical protein ACFE0J_00755 [Elainellaceae cyanobacterium]